MERRIRASIQYARWSERNRAAFCVRCGEMDDLEVHHIIELYHIIMGLWKFYGDWDSVFKHAIAMHDGNRCEEVTLCKKCHDGVHPGRAVIIQESDIHTDDWCVVPRNLDIKFGLGKRGLNDGDIGLFGFQAIFGIGWNIMNGYGGGRIIDFNWKRFAELVGKKPSSSFSKGLSVALDSIQCAKIIDAWAQNKNDIEVHISQSYLEEMIANPWFVPLTDIKTSRMTVLVLRWILSFQANRSGYSIGQDKLATHMQFTTKTPAFISRCIKESIDEISWATVIETRGKFHFKFKKRGMTPIHSLRSLLVRSLTH